MKDEMSRDQKPGKFKLVGGQKPNLGRRIDDQVEGEAQAEGLQAVVSAPAAAPAKGPGLVLPLLFLVACAGGGAGAVFFGLAGGQAG